MQTMVIDISKCRRRFECVKICPTEAIEIRGEYPCYVHIDDCWGCRCCVDACETGALIWREQPRA